MDGVDLLIGLRFAKATQVKTLKKMKNVNII